MELREQLAVGLELLQVSRCVIAAKISLVLYLQPPSTCTGTETWSAHLLARFENLYSFATRLALLRAFLCMVAVLWLQEPLVSDALTALARRHASVTQMSLSQVT